MFLGNRLLLIVLVVMSLMMTSCNVTRKLSDGSYLITKNRVNISFPDTLPKSERIKKSDLEAFIPLSQVPNKRLFGGNFFLWVYNLSDTAKNNWGNRLLRRIGEPPVIFDSTAMLKSTDEMGVYMSARGFYGSTVTDSVRYKKKRSYVNYNITTGSPFIVSEINYNFIDKSLEPLILKDSAASLIKVGNPLDRIVMEKERSRIAAQLENNGYYQFSVNNISYLIDTLSGGNRASIKININKSISDNNYVENLIYRIRNIYVNPDYMPYVADSSMVSHRVDTLQYNGINFIYTGGRINVRPEVLARALSIYPGAIYDRNEIDYTSARISNLKLFKNVNILFNEVNDEDSLSQVTYVGAKDSITTTFEGAIDCTILCSPMLRQSYKVDTEISTNSNYTGVALTLGYANKNFFKGAELFDISGKTAYQFVRAPGKKDSYEFGGKVSMTFVRLLTPFGIARYTRAQNTSTSFEASVNSQRRPDYDRIISSFNFGYQWSKSGKFSFTFKPLSVSLIKVPWIDSTYLASITNPYLRNSYASQMIFGINGGFNYSTLNSGRDNAFAVRFNGETSGNFLNLMSIVFNSTKTENQNESYYEALGIRYAQYFRGELSFIYQRALGVKSSLVSRLFIGGGYAYGNTRSLPFERMFFAGGAYSMRGWQVRSLGPGSTPAPPRNSYPNQVGDLRLEANLEGRFPIAGPLHGALFLDVGNVWSNGKGEQNDYARFKFNSFYKQLAMDAGVGARFDFNFFVLRVDWGIQLRNPGWGEGNMWIHEFKFANTALHFAIGYPF